MLTDFASSNSAHGNTAGAQLQYKTNACIPAAKYCIAMDSDSLDEV